MLKDYHTDNATRALVYVKRKLRGFWIEWLRVNCIATAVQIVDETHNGEFTLLVAWQNKDGTAGEHRKRFDAALLYTKRNRCVGDFARDMLHAVFDIRFRSGG